MPRPLAYHITWGTYGTRLHGDLHGDARGTVDRNHNQPGTPVLGPDPEREAEEIEFRKFPPVELTKEQRLFIESALPEICQRGHWELFTRAAGPDHVHVVLRSTFDPEVIRRLLKRWVGEALSEKWPQEPGRTWWAEGGSIKWVMDRPYLANATGYVRRQQTHRRRARGK